MHRLDFWDIRNISITIYLMTVCNLRIDKTIIQFPHDLLGHFVLDMVLKNTKEFNVRVAQKVTCIFQLSFSSIITPRYLILVTRSIDISLVTISFKFCSIGLFGVWKNTKFVLATLIVNRFALHQWNKPWKACDTLFFDVFRFWSYINNEFMCDLKPAICLIECLYYDGLNSTHPTVPQMEVKCG